MTTVAPSLCLKKCSLTIAHTAVSENGTYAVLFDGSGDSASFGTRLPDDLFANCQSNGGDICFSSDAAGATQLNVEIVPGSIDTVNKKAEIWVSVTLNVTTDVVIYVWYKGSSTLSQPAASGTYGSQSVWSTIGNNLLIIHGGTSSSLSVVDSTSNANNGTNHSCTAIAGQIGGAINSASGQYVTIADASGLSGMSTLTISLWMKATGFSDTPGLCGKYSPSGGKSWIVRVNPSGTISFYTETTALVSVTSSASLSPSVKYKIDAVYDGSRNRIYIGGAADANTILQTGVIATSSGVEVVLNADYDTNDSMAGWTDELRIRSTADSPNRVSTDTQIQSSTTLVTVGTPVSTAGSGKPGIRTGGNLANVGLMTGSKL